MNKNDTIPALLCPLVFAEAEPNSREPMTCEKILEFLCTKEIKSDSKAVADRYQEVSREELPLYFAPSEEKFLKNIVYPLRHAKGSYIIGNYLGTIALSGLVAEMLTILIYDAFRPTINGQPMDQEKEKALFDRPFEKLGQERRVRILRAYGMIDDCTKKEFDLIRSTRNKYLHLWSADRKNLASDAIKIYQKVVSIVIKIVGSMGKDGIFHLSPVLLNYLNGSSTGRTDDLNHSGAENNEIS
ncbi:MAG: hypothetical protein ABIH23_06030, partial [bacterium]